MNVKLKKILSCFLIMLLLFNALFSCVVYADEHGGSSGDLDVTPSITIPPSPPDPAEFLIRMILPDGGEAIDYVSDWLEKRWKTDDDKQKDYSVSSDGSTVHFHKQFVDELNNAIQNKVYALNGYYLLEPAAPYNMDDIGKYLYEHNLMGKNIADNPTSSLVKFFSQVGSDHGAVVFCRGNYGFDYLGLGVFYDGYYPYIRISGNTYSYHPGSDTQYVFYWADGYSSYDLYTDRCQKNFYFSSDDITNIINNDAVFFCNRPIKIFYSLEDAKKYAENGQRRT